MEYYKRGHVILKVRLWRRTLVERLPPEIFLGDQVERTLGTSNALPKPTQSLHGLPPTLGRQLSAADKVFPHKVVRTLERGMLEYIPLDVLTDEACRNASREPPAPETSFVVSNGKWQLPGASFDVSKEGRLTFGEWCGAGENLVDAMRKNLRAEGEDRSGGPVAQAIAGTFASHFKRLRSLPNARVEFDVVLDYDRHLRSLFLSDSHTFSMADFHQDIWRKCESHQNTRRLKEMADILQPSPVHIPTGANRRLLAVEMSLALVPVL
ncbi:hypothetical protein J132_10438 [Termitomyces sp. J132]|nr:hypothetical protein J132_10438 [Termitomyces sp. J132]